MMEIHPNLYVGNEADCQAVIREKGWWIVHACKEPYHRQALGYTGRGAPKDHPEYLIAYRGNRLALNLIDAADPAYVPKKAIDATLAFIQQGLIGGHRVLVHCNQGESRSATIGLLYLLAHTTGLPSGSLQQAEFAYLSIYPAYRPGPGMRGFMEAHWREYLTR